jgi:aminoglycoside phosphotransferase (APT) family kinase protein
MYATEVYFYRDLLPSLALEHPAVYAIDHAEGSTEFSILMEDISLRPGARVGIVTLPVTADDVAAVLATLARLHAAYWDSPRLPWLDATNDSVTVSFWQQIGPRLVRRHLESGHRAEVVDQARWSQARMWAAFARLQEENAKPPRTVLHGDVHAGNVYYLDGPFGGLLDWQLMLTGSWALDVGYLLATTLDPSLRASHERQLLAGYLDELGRLGVQPPTFEEAWLQYRMQPIWGVLMWLITPNGVHSDEVQNTSLERCLAAGDHLGTLEALGV